MAEQARGLILAWLLAMLAGTVDAIGFLRLGHLFVSFMSGNTTRLSVAATKGDWPDVRQGGVLVAMFVAGAAIGGATEETCGRWHLSAILGLVAVLLAVAAQALLPPAETMAFAMGALNAALHRAGPIRFGITYVTGALSMLGQGLGRWVVSELAGRPGNLDWLAQAIVWIGLVAGVAGGAGLVAALGSQAPWVPAGAALALAVLAPVLLKGWHEQRESV